MDISKKPFWENAKKLFDGFQRVDANDTKRVSKTIELQATKSQRHRLNLLADSKFHVLETPEGLLLRPVDPPLTKIYLEPTTNCNLNCRTCMRNSWSEPAGDMTMETYGRLIKNLKPVKSLKTIAFWGIGEPLLHPNIVEMIRTAKTLKVKTELITNGLLLTKDMSEGLIEAGLDTLVVSMDGTSPESFSDIRRGADFDAVQQNVRFLNAARKAKSYYNPEVGIEFVAMRRNITEMNNLIPMARAMEASFVIVTNVLPYTDELQNEILYWLSAGDFYPSTRSKWRPEIILPRIDARPENLEHLQALSSQVITGGFRPKLNAGADGCCPFIWEGAAAITWDGSVSPCVALMHSYECYIMGRRKSIKKYVAGNVNEQDFVAIWNSDAYARFRKKVQEFDFAPCISCGGCDMADSNEEDCFNNTFPTCGDCLWARGILLCP